MGGTRTPVVGGPRGRLRLHRRNRERSTRRGRTKSGFNGAAQLTIEAMLQAPQFLYRLELGRLDQARPERSWLTGDEVASRMSYLLWGSAPDSVLMGKAQAKQLELPAEREKEARRMLADRRAAGMFVEFHRQWLEFDRLDREPKDPKTYPAYTAELKAAIREESNRFVADVMGSGDGTIGSLLTSPNTQVNAPLAKLYGAPAPASGWADTSLNQNERAGLLTRANFLAARRQNHD